MLVLRGTKKVLRYLPPPTEQPGDSDTALGDWYANRIVVDRQPLLLLVSSRSLLSILVPARNVRSFPARLAETIGHRLERLGIDKGLIESEMQAMDTVVVAKTCDRSVLGTMNDFAKSIPFYLGSQYWNETSLHLTEGRLEETPCRASGRFEDCIFPDRKTKELLVNKWLGKGYLRLIK